MFTTQELSGGVTEKQLITRLTEFLARRFEDRGRASDAATELVALWRGRTWVLTDVGSSPANHGLIYQFTHRTFLEFFAAVEIVRHNSSPEALWRVLAEPIRLGEWEIVAQLAIQKLNELCLDGADQVLALLIDEEEELHGMPREHSNLLSFAARNLDSLYAKPSTQRRLVDSAMRLAMRMVPFTSDVQSTNWSLLDDIDSTAEWLGLFQPLTQLLATTGDRRELVIDELLRHGCAQLDSDAPKTAATAFVLLLSPAYLEKLAKVSSQSFSYIREVEIPAALWNRTEIERRLGHPLSADRVREWGQHNFWAAVLAAREGLISVEDMVRAAGAASVACSADPFIEFHLELADSSPLEQLLLRYLDLAAPDDNCPVDAAEAHRTLTLVGQELTAGAPRFVGLVLATTVLYQRVVGRRFRGDVGVTPEDLDAAFGAAVLLAVVVEREEWRALNSFLALGPLRGLDPVYLARTGTVQGDKIDEVLDRFGFAEPQKRILADWARKRTDFVSG